MTNQITDNFCLTNDKYMTNDIIDNFSLTNEMFFYLQFDQWDENDQWDYW